MGIEVFQQKRAQHFNFVMPTLFYQEPVIEAAVCEQARVCCRCLLQKIFGQA